MDLLAYDLNVSAAGESSVLYTIYIIRVRSCTSYRSLMVDESESQELGYRRLIFELAYQGV
jgi:hypothetical protein